MLFSSFARHYLYVLIILKKVFVVLPVYIKLNVFVKRYFIKISQNLEDHEKITPETQKWYRPSLSFTDNVLISSCQTSEQISL